MGAYPSSPLSATGSLAGVAEGQATSASRSRHRRSSWRPLFSRPFLLNSRSVAAPSGATGLPSWICHTVSASCASCARSQYCRAQTADQTAGTSATQSAPAVHLAPHPTTAGHTVSR